MNVSPTDSTELYSFTLYGIQPLQPAVLLVTPHSGDDPLLWGKPTDDGTRPRIHSRERTGSIIQGDDVTVGPYWELWVCEYWRYQDSQSVVLYAELKVHPSPAGRWYPYRPRR